MPSLEWLVRVRDAELRAAVETLRARLDGCGLRDAGDAFADTRARGGGSRPDGVVVWTDEALPAATVEALLGLGAPLVLAGPTLEAGDADGALAEAAGLDVGRASPVHDVRIRAGAEAGVLAGLQDHGHAGTAHLGEHLHVEDRVLAVEKAADDVNVLLTASLGLTVHPVATWRPATRVLAWTPGTRAEAVTAPSAVRLLVLAVRRALGLGDPPPVRVGLLGYGAIGHEHNRAVHAVPGLELAAVCDVSPGRLAAARGYAPDARTYTSPEDLVADDGVDLVVVSTPPSSHASWALACLTAGKHVVVEKPFAIRTSEADAVLAASAERGLFAGVYQNRRFDPDHVAIRRAVDAGLLGELFHLEAFVGGYGHPCNLWHSDVGVSGGAFYDWGAHVLDQLLDLVPDEIAFVTAAEQKLRWFDVTNADHSRVTVHFAGGAEATFVYSDLAAALKPRWYVLGTRGAVVGTWRTASVIARSDVGTLAEDVLAPADSPPLLDLHSGDGSVTRLALPALQPYAYHAQLADHLRLGLPASVTGAQSRRVLSVMEAASESAGAGGQPVVPR